MKSRRLTSKATKLAHIARRRHYLSTLVRHRVAATTEHLVAIGQCAPATLIDVGANKGQFSTAVRGLFPSATIHAFEPLPEAGDVFAAVFAHDDRVHLHRVAIGSSRATMPFYVTDRADSSSLLRPGAGQKAAFGVSTASEIAVKVVPLSDEIDLTRLPTPIMMKVDVQGAELEVLRGCSDLSAIDHIYVELSFVELYEGQALFDEVRAYLETSGFELGGVFNEVSTPHFGRTQADCLFTRRPNARD